MNIAECLASTRYADSHDPAIERAVRNVCGDRTNPQERAVALFRFVRDHVHYTFGPWGVRASETLTSRVGTCANKNNLLVACFRKAGIPAAYGVLRVVGQEYFGEIAPSQFKPLVSRNSTHLYAAAFLGDRWVRCDSSTDAEIALRTAHYCPQTRLVHWDGERDALDFLDPAHLHCDLGLFAQVDDLLDKPPVNATPEVLALLNDYVAFIREHQPFASIRALKAAYFSRDVALPSSGARGVHGSG